MDKTFHFPTNIHFESVDDFVRYVKTSCPDIFQDFSIYGLDKLKFQIKPRIYFIRFLGGFHFMLGYDTDEINVRPKKDTVSVKESNNFTDFKTTYKYQLNRGLKNFNIISNICHTTQIGNGRMPLLKNVVVDDIVDATTSYGQLRHVEVQNPMYVGVATTLLNRIDIKIVNNVGNSVKFENGALTSITLHFKRTINKYSNY